MNIRSNDDLGIFLDQLIVYSKENFLARTVLQVLDIVDQKIIAVEQLLFDLVDRISVNAFRAHRFNEQGDEIAAIHIDDFFLRTLGCQIIADRVKKVGFSQAGVAVQH